MKPQSQSSMLIFVLACTLAAVGAQRDDFHENNGKKCGNDICKRDQRCAYAQVSTGIETDPCPVVIPVCLPKKECPAGPQKCDPNQCKTGTYCKLVKTPDCQRPQPACIVPGEHDCMP